MQHVCVCRRGVPVLCACMCLRMVRVRVGGTGDGLLVVVAVSVARAHACPRLVPYMLNYDQLSSATVAVYTGVPACSTVH